MLGQARGTTQVIEFNSENPPFGDDDKQCSIGDPCPWGKTVHDSFEQECGWRQAKRAATCNWAGASIGVISVQPRYGAEGELVAQRRKLRVLAQGRNGFRPGRPESIAPKRLGFQEVCAAQAGSSGASEAPRRQDATAMNVSFPTTNRMCRRVLTLELTRRQNARWEYGKQRSVLAFGFNDRLGPKWAKEKRSASGSITLGLARMGLVVI